jgi:hypothetical protein
MERIKKGVKLLQHIWIPFVSKLFESRAESGYPFRCCDVTHPLLKNAKVLLQSASCQLSATVRYDDKLQRNCHLSASRKNCMFYPSRAERFSRYESSIAT